MSGGHNFPETRREKAQTRCQSNCNLLDFRLPFPWSPKAFLFLLTSVRNAIFTRIWRYCEGNIAEAAGSAGHTCCHCWDTKLTFTLYYRKNGETKQILSCNCTLEILQRQPHHELLFSAGIFCYCCSNCHCLCFIWTCFRSRRFLSPASGGHQNCRKREPGSQWHCHQLNYICDWLLAAEGCLAFVRWLMTGPPKQAAQYARRRWLLSGHAPHIYPQLPPHPTKPLCPVSCDGCDRKRCESW